MKKQIDSPGLKTRILALGTAVALLGAAQPDALDQVTVKDGKPAVLQQGQLQPLKKTLDLTEAIKVMTNATFTVNNGKPRQLTEGQVLDNKGMLTSPDGTVVPVLDHLSMKQGKVRLVRDGVESVLRQDMLLPSGARVKPDGVMLLPNGRLHRLIDGQMLTLNGSVLPAQDTVTLRQGKVFVQRDGTQFSLDRPRSIMMNDGTKVFGDGKVVQPNGKTLQLTEGQILKLEGVKLQPL